MYKKLCIALNIFREIPVYLIYINSKNRKKIDMDIRRWVKELNINCKNNFFCLCYLLLFYKEYRNLFNYRINSSNKILGKISSILYKGLESLIICTEKIGGGLFIQHGFATIIAAKSIGENCWINQQVTIGHTNKSDSPTIGNNVRVTCGVKVLGNVKIEDNCVIGSNAVVIKDIPKNAVAVGVPAKVAKYI